MLGIITEWGGLLIDGALTTLGLFALMTAPVLLLTFFVGFCRISRFFVVRALATVYVDFFRGVSLIVTMFWIYFALPFLGVSMSAWMAAIVATALVHSAYCSEFVRSTIRSIPKGQFEAATALSMSRYQRMRYVILPQALAAMMPLFGNEVILLLKATSVASLITIAELTSQGHSIVVRTYQAFPVFVIVLLIYYAMAQALTWGMRRLENVVGHWRSPSTPIIASNRMHAFRIW